MNVSAAHSNADRKLVQFLAVVVDRDSGLIGKDYSWEHRSLHEYIGTVPASIEKHQVYKSAQDDIDGEQEEDLKTLKTSRNLLLHVHIHIHILQLHRNLHLEQPPTQRVKEGLGGHLNPRLLSPWGAPERWMKATWPASR
jgi:hypothetical protein